VGFIRGYDKVGGEGKGKIVGIMDIVWGRWVIFVVVRIGVDILVDNVGDEDRWEVLLVLYCLLLVSLLLFLFIFNLFVCIVSLGLEDIDFLRFFKPIIGIKESSEGME